MNTLERILNRFVWMIVGAFIYAAIQSLTFPHPSNEKAVTEWICNSLIAPIPMCENTKNGK